MEIRSYRPITPSIQTSQSSGSSSKNPFNPETKEGIPRTTAFHITKLQMDTKLSILMVWMRSKRFKNMTTSLIVLHLNRRTKSSIKNLKRAGRRRAARRVLVTFLIQV
jgi:hypothetical protein